MMRITAFLRRARSFVRSKHGTAAIEFAFIAPVLVLFYFATVELSMLIEAKRKVTTTASTIADLIAQTEEIDSTEVNSILDAADAIMQPLDASGIQMRVTSLVMDSNGDTKVAWSQATNMTPYGCGAEIAPPDGVLTPGQSIVYAETSYTYTPPIGSYLTGDIELRDTFYLRPRLSVEVAYVPDPCPGV